MLDVMHYLFETDTNFVSNEHMQSKTESRRIIYEHIYNKKLKYSYDSGRRSQGYDFGDGEDEFDFDAPVNPTISRETKPYFPPTNFNPDSPNPFQGTLREAPLG